MGDTWHLVTGEYPPQPGGVSDYTATLATALASRGLDVHVWAPEAGSAPVPAPPGVTVHRLSSGYDKRGLRALSTGLDAISGSRVILIQYVPQAFGARGMNLAFCRWAQRRARHRRDDVRVMIHEPYYPFTWWPPRRNALAFTNRLMAVLLLSDVRVAYVSTDVWERRLRKYAPRALRFVWMPVPSAIPSVKPGAATAAWRARLGAPGVRVVGHFGTYGAGVARLVAPTLAALLQRRADVHVVLIGGGSSSFAALLTGSHPEWRSRVTATDRIAPAEVAACLCACEVVVQPYADGASGRRTTLMAALANGVPAVTNAGPATEAVWRTGDVVALAERSTPAALADAAIALIDDDERRRAMGAAGAALYAARFAIEHSVDTLLDPNARSA